MRAPDFGFKVESENGRTTLTIPDRYPSVAVYLLFLDCVLVTMAASHGHSQNGNPSFELPGFFVYAGIIALTVLVMLCVTNSVRVTRTSKALALTRFFLGIPGSTEFNLADIRNVRVYGPLRNNKMSRKFQVLFDYGQDTVTLARGMTQPAATLIAERLTATTNA